MRRSVAFAFAAEIGTTVAMMASFRFASDYWGVAGFAEWVMVRRILAFVVPVMTVGVDIGLTRTLSQSRKSAGDGVILAAALVVLCGTLALGLAMLVFEDRVARLLFGSLEHEHLIVPLVAISAGYSLAGICFATFRGQSNFQAASFVQLGTAGAIPLLVLLSVHDSPGQTILVTGVILVGIGVALLLERLFRAGPQPGEIVGHAQDLCRYGFGRMVAALLLMGLSLLPVVVAANLIGIKTAGFIAFALSIVGLAGTTSAPIQLMLLPLTSLQQAEGRMEDIRRSVRQIEIVVLGVAVLAAVVLPIAATYISIIFLGYSDEGLVRALSIMGLAIGPFVYFVCLRQVIDACSERPLNSFSLVVALLVFGLVFALSRLLIADVTVIVLFSYISAVWTLALTTRWALTCLLAR